jgi:hypothetical protein
MVQLRIDSHEERKSKCNGKRRRKTKYKMKGNETEDGIGKYFFVKGKVKN